MRSDWLEAFLTFSTHMNFTRAANSLHISQPALHVKIRKLSDHLGIPLYSNTGRQLLLTPEGQQVAAFALEQQEQSRAFVDILQTGSSHRPVVLCAGEGAYLYLLGPTISEFSSTSPHPLRLMTGNQDRTFELLMSGEAHLGVSAPDTIPTGITSELLTEIDQVLIMPRTHRLATRRQIHLTDLHGEALIVPPRDRPHRVMINRMLMDAGVSWRVAVEANGWELMRHFVSMKIGLAIINGCCHIGPGLISKPLPELPRIRYQLLQRTAGSPNASIVRLKNLLHDNRNTWREDRK